MAIRHVGWVFALLALSWTSQAAGADDAKLKAIIASMLDSGWRTTSAGRSEAERYFAQAQAAVPSDVRGLYALALVQIKHHRYTDAAATVQQVLDAQPKHWGAWQARIWLAVVAKKYSAALLDMEALAKAMPRDEAEVDAEEPLRDAAQMMGRIFGFLGGPLSKSVKEDVLADHEERILTRLPTGRRAAFDRGRRTVAERFAEMQQETYASKTEAKDDEQKKKDVQIEQLKEQKAAVTDEKAGIDKQATDARAVAEKTIAGLERQAAPLIASFNTLNTQAAALQANVASLSLQVAGLQDQAAAETDPTRRELLLVQASVTGTSLARYEAQLAGVVAQLNQVRGQIAVLENQRAAAVAAYEAEMNRLGRKADNLVRTERRIAGATADASRPVIGSSAKVRALSSGMMSLSTFQEFPLDREKQRLLDSFTR